MILLGAALAICGAVVLRLARPAAVRTRRAGAALVLAGLALSAAAAIVLAVESM